jgi:thymidylate synthase (FAD)
MKLIKPYTEIWEQAPGMEGMLRHIERCARVCYKSEDKIGEGTAEKMFEMLKDRGHTAMLEHGTVYLTIPREDKLTWQEYTGSIWCAVDFDHERVYVTTNYRYMYENGLLNDLTFQTEPFIGHKRRITVHFVCDRGISHELVRHRVFSFAQESTRYCNYSKDKFGNELTFIVPCWADTNKFSKNTIITHDEFGNLIGEYYYHLSGKEASYFKPWKITPENNFIVSLQVAEQIYLELLNEGWTPQQARSVLPNSLKTEVCMTGFESDWDHFFELRCAQAAHPQMRELAIPLQETFKTL